MAVKAPTTIPGAQIDRLITATHHARTIVAFTGAGISTASGIPDYRGPNGVWATQKPPTLGDFVTNPEAQREYWVDRQRRYPELLARQPNSGHEALVALERSGKLAAVVTQNIDGLHLKAGHQRERVIEIHGSAHRVRCLECDAQREGAEIQQRQELGELIPVCDVCGGVLRAATILFGEAMPKDALAVSMALAQSCDLMLAIGSSLVVQPAAKVPLIAKRAGATLAILNNEPTPLDESADIVIRDDISLTLTALLQGIEQGNTLDSPTTVESGSSEG